MGRNGLMAAQSEGASLPRQAAGLVLPPVTPGRCLPQSPDMPGRLVSITMPDPPPGQTRRLLQATWDFACRTLRWPTFAELDRVLDSLHNIQAVDVIRGMPPEFIYGASPGSPVPTMDSQEIALTVAGVAACQDTSEILSIFVEFIQMATSIEKGWLPAPGELETRPGLTDTEFAQRSKTLPAAGRGDLLQLLFLMLKVERPGWAGLSANPSTGHWTIYVSRQIRDFRNIVDIGDYWSRRSKPCEARVPASTPAGQATTSPDSGERAKLLAVHPALLADVLLQMIYNEARAHSPQESDTPAGTVVQCPQVEPTVDPIVIAAALRLLESQGLIQIALADVTLTESGAARVAQARRVMENPVARAQAARDALLAWLYDQRTGQQDAEHVDKFLSDPRSAANGLFFSLTDVDDAARYLQEKDLIDGARVDERRGPVIASITATGIDCAEQGGNVADFEKQPAKDSVSYSFNAPVSGTNIAVGGQATQHAVVHGPASEADGRTGRRSDAIRAAVIGGWFVIAAAIVGAVLAAFLTNGFGFFALSPGARSSPSTSPSSAVHAASGSSAIAIERRYDGKDPTGKDGSESKCADPPASQPVSQVHPPVIGPGGTVVGHIELRTSSICPVIWARVYWLNGSYLMPSGWSLHILMHRRVHPKTVGYISYDTSNYVYGNMLTTISGCVYAEVYFAKGTKHTPPATTACFKST